jgi:deoxyribodipyrimidine photo-lyase
MTIQSARITPLNHRPEQEGEYVLYWMQQSQRAEWNHALEYAVRKGNASGRPVVVCFGLSDRYPEANGRHFRFMLEGLRETAETLRRRGIPMVLRLGAPDRVALDLAGRAALVVCDRGYLRHQHGWRRAVARNAPCPVVRVESDAIVPLEMVSAKAEYAARTLRPRIRRQLHDWLVPLSHVRPLRSAMGLPLHGEDPSDTDGLMARLAVDRSVPPVSALFPGGARAAMKRFRAFLAEGLCRYDANSGQPQTDDVSHMSPYLHFGQISPLRLALLADDAHHAGPENRAAFLEQLIVRRELALNFVRYQPDYDRYAALPKWARTTLDAHRGDLRDHLYTPEQMADGATHDPYWNAAMAEMRHTGFMHNHMRMYWGKKILQWSPSPEAGFETALRLNNRYFLDGRDPNSYAGVLWTFGLHDRAWKERPVFGKVRYMNAAGLKRKCDIAAYVRKVDALVRKVT